MSLNKSLKNAMLASGGLVPFASNAPARYADKQTQYLSPETQTFKQQMAKYSNDYVSARVQGIDRQNPFAWQTRTLRLADVVRPSAAILRRADNYKMVIFADRDIEYLMPGAKIETMGSTWLVTNPFNVSGADGAAIVERCNAVWNYLDFYGNVVSEPMVVSNRRADANDSDAQEGNLITKGYFNVAMQYNDVTAQIDTNTRFILGTGAWRVTGYSDFLQEFTGDYGSVRILEFTIRYEEPNDEIDDMVNHVAGGKQFSWEIFITGSPILTVGDTAKFTAQSQRNGETVDEYEHDLFHVWSVGDESIATVDVLGNVTGVSEGTTYLRCTLAQNPNIYTEIDLNVGQAETVNAVAFTDEPPEYLNAYEECDVSAYFFQNGAKTTESVTWTFSGAAEGSFRTMTGPNAATIYCFGYSKTPLTVTASCGDYSVSAEIQLRGM